MNNPDGDEGGSILPVTRAILGSRDHTGLHKAASQSPDLTHLLLGHKLTWVGKMKGRQVTKEHRTPTEQ